MFLTQTAIHINCLSLYLSSINTTAKLPDFCKKSRSLNDNNVGKNLEFFLNKHLMNQTIDLIKFIFFVLTLISYNISLKFIIKIMFIKLEELVCFNVVYFNVVK